MTVWYWVDSFSSPSLARVTPLAQTVRVPSEYQPLAGYLAAQPLGATMTLTLLRVVGFAHLAGDRLGSLEMG